jgi:hypothetical protein
LSTINGAAVTLFEVNAAAALAGTSATISAKSGRPLAFKPAFVAPKRNPCGMINLDRSVMSVFAVNPFNLAEADRNQGLQTGQYSREINNGRADSHSKGNNRRIDNA